MQIVLDPLSYFALVVSQLGKTATWMLFLVLALKYEQLTDILKVMRTVRHNKLAVPWMCYSFVAVKLVAVSRRADEQD